MRGEPVWVEGAWRSGAPNTPGLRKGPFLFVSGAVPIDLSTGESVGTDIGEQTAQVIDNIEAVLRAGGASLDDVVKTTVFLTDNSMAKGMNDVYRQRFAEPFPARSTFQVGPLSRPEYLIEVEAIAWVGD
jgi:reactive intermediate/imine deaminase